MVASFVEGRVRLRHSGLQKTSIVDRVTRELETRAGIEQVAPNRKVGSLLVCYDRAVTTLEEILDVLRAYLKDTPFPQKAPSLPKRPSARKMPRISMSRRRVVNLSLLVSFIGSMAALFVDAKTIHIQLGVLFVALAVQHLFDKRRTLLV